MGTGRVSTVRTVAINCVRDELDIVEPFVRHTLACVDRLVVLDNGSTDGTRALLERLIDEGLPLEVVDDPSAGNYQWRRMTHLMHAYAIKRHAADWIIPLDVDEFLAVEDLSEIVRQENSQSHPIGVSWQTYVADPEDDPHEINPVLRIRHRLREEARRTIKVLIPSKLVSGPAVRIAQGNHFLENRVQPVETRVAGNAFLGHFPARSPEQYARKVAVKHLQYLAMADRRPEWGCHYQTAVEWLRIDPAQLEADFQRKMLRCGLPEEHPFHPELIVAPLAYRGGPLMYTPPTSHRSLVQSLLECAEMIARGYKTVSSEQYRLNIELDALTEELQRKEADLEAMRQSWSWHVGRVATSPVRWFKRHLRAARGARFRNKAIMAHTESRAA
jgi:hypothetical protein